MFRNVSHISYYTNESKDNLISKDKSIKVIRYCDIRSYYIIEEVIY